MCSRFKFTFLVTPLAFIVTMAFHVSRLVQKLTGTDMYDQWDDGTIYFGYVVHNIFSRFLVVTSRRFVMLVNTHTYMRAHTCDI
jgi:hypothetical protein